MEYDRYCQLAEEASNLVESDDGDKAIGIFNDLLASDISGLDKSIACVNIATIHEKFKREREALAAFDRGINYESLHSRNFVAEQKAAYLSRIGRIGESIQLFEEILTRLSLMESDKARIKHNIKTLKGQPA